MTETLLTERHSTHGRFKDNAELSQALKYILRQQFGWSKLSMVQREALEMICLKVSRIMSGKPYELQHWEDIVGYAELAIKEINGAPN